MNQVKPLTNNGLEAENEMENKLNTYRMISDQEPKEDELNSLMHEVAVEAIRKSEIAKAELKKRVHQELQSALAREGYRGK